MQLKNVIKINPTILSEFIPGVKTPAGMVAFREIHVHRQNTVKQRSIS